MTAPETPVANATVTASSESVNGTATFSAAQPPTVAVPAAASPSTVTGTTCNFSALGADAAGESNLTYTWSTTGTPPAAVSFSTNGSNAAKNTTATFTAAGNYSFQVTITDPSGLTATSTVNVTVNQALTAITVSPPSITLPTGGTQQYAATAEDQFGAAMALQPTFTWATTAGTISAAGLLTAPGTPVASAAVTASSGGVSGTATFAAANPPTVAVPAAASPATVTGTTCNLSALGADAAGESDLTYTWSTTGTPPAAVSFSTNGSNAAKNTTATFTAAGNYSFQVTITDPGGLTAASTVNVTVNQTLTAISVSPASVNLNGGGTQQYTATAEDQFGAALATQPTFAWATAAGTITTAGLLTAPNTPVANATVTATSGTVSGTAAFTVAAAAPSQSVSGSPDTRYVVPGQTFDFTVEYNSSNADLTGLGLRIFYNPQVLTFNAFDNVLQTGLFQVQPQPTANTSNLDGYPSTYNYVQIAWADITGTWPNASLPTGLAVLNFTLASGVSLGTTTSINFAATSTAASYAFSSTPVTVTAVPADLDVTSAGTVSDAVDGALSMRYMFGFSGDALVSGLSGGPYNATTIAASLDAAQQVTPNLLNPDGSATKVADALSDGIIIRRYLSDQAPENETQWDGPDLIENALIPGDPSPAPTWQEVWNTLDEFNPYVPALATLTPQSMVTVNAANQPAPAAQAPSAAEPASGRAVAAASKPASVVTPDATPAVSKSNGPLVAAKTARPQPVKTDPATVVTPHVTPVVSKSNGPLAAPETARPQTVEAAAVTGQGVTAAAPAKKTTAVRPGVTAAASPAKRALVAPETDQSQTVDAAAAGQGLLAAEPASGQGVAAAVPAKPASVVAPDATPAVSKSNGPLVAPETDQVPDGRRGRDGCAGPANRHARPGQPDGHRGRCGGDSGQLFHGPPKTRL